MATTYPGVDQFQATQKQMLDTFAENYQKMVSSMTPEETPARTAAELALEYFNRMRSIVEPFGKLETPESFVSAMMDSMKASSELNMEFSNKYMDLYKESMGKLSPSLN